MDDNDPLTEHCRGRIGRVLNGKWHLDQLIGVGGMAAVYAGTHRNGARAAIKVLHGELSHHGEARERFLREAYIANRVEHPGTVRALDDDTSEQGELYLVMELLRGESVDARAGRSQGRLPLAEVLWIADHVLAVLELAHAAGVVHRDLKPENLFVTEGGELKVLDFGIARLRESASDKRTQTGMMMGTPVFMAPEQALARWSLVDGRTDLWAVGAIIFNLVTGRYVHEASTMNETLIRAATQPAPSLVRALPSAPLALVKLVDRALSFDQQKRFADAATMREQVKQLIASTGPAPMMATASTAAQPRPLTIGDPSPPAASATPLVAPVAAASSEPNAAGPSPHSVPPLDPMARALAVAQAAKARRTREGIAPTYVSAVSRSGRDPRAEPDVETAETVAPARRQKHSAPPPIAEPAPSAAQGPALDPTAGLASPRVEIRQDPSWQDLVVAPTAPAHAPPDAAPAQAASVAPRDAPAPTEPDQDRFDAGEFAVSFVPEEDKRAMQDLFTAIDRALVTRRQYGPDHTETVRRIERSFSVCASALMHSDNGLLWNVTPYSFVAGDVTLWEPAAPLDQIPYQLFADGVRTLGFLPGLTEVEFTEILRILTMDRSSEVAPEDDLVTLLWEACFEHVVHQAIDSLGEGDQQARARFARDHGQLVALAHFETNAQLEACWGSRAAPSAPLSIEGRRKRLRTLLSGSEPTDMESTVQALSLQDGPTGKAADLGDALRVDEHALAMLQARLGIDTSTTGERFVLAAVKAYESLIERGLDPDRVTSPLRSAIDGLAASRPDLAMEMIRALCVSVSSDPDKARGDTLRASLAGAVVSAKTFERILTGSSAPDATSSLWATGLRMLLGLLNDAHIKPVILALPTIRDPEVQAEIVNYLRRVGRGHEAELEALFAEADIELGLALVRILAEIPTDAARNAIAQAAHSPHAVVRIEALAHVDGASSDRVRLELRSLLQDREPEVRIAALRTMQKHKIRVAGPFLVMSIRESGFDSLPVEERRQALDTVATLAPARAEAVCLELLADARLLSAEAREKTRELAAEVLGRVASSEESLKAIEKISTSRWRTSEDVRKASMRALETARSRLAKPSKESTS